MKKSILILFLYFVIIKPISAQLLCVQCFDQNDSIGVNVGSHNLIINGGFENTTCTWSSFCPNSSSYTGCSIANWSCTGGGSSSNPVVIDSNFYKVEEGTKAAYLGNNFCDACSTGNDTTCLHWQDCNVTGVPIGYPISPSSGGGTTGVCLSQVVTGLIAGNTYILEFWAGGRYQLGSIEGLFAVDVGFGNIYLKNKPTPAHTGIGTRYLVEFVATSTSHTIKFTNWGALGNGNSQVVLDNVRLYPPQYLPNPNAVCTLGINEDILTNELTLSPNPAANEIKIESKMQNAEIEIRDVLGQTVYSTKAIAASSTIDVSMLSKGVYFINLQNGKQTINKKLVKE